MMNFELHEIKLSGCGVPRRAVVLTVPAAAARLRRQDVPQRPFSRRMPVQDYDLVRCLQPPAHGVVGECLIPSLRELREDYAHPPGVLREGTQLLPAVTLSPVHLADETAAPADRGLDLKVPAAVHAPAPPPGADALKPQQADKPIGQQKEPDAPHHGEASDKSGAEQRPGQEEQVRVISFIRFFI